MEFRIALLHRASAPLFAAVLAACSQTATAPADAGLAMASSTGTPATTKQVVPAATRITVHRDAYCGCCHLWIAHLRQQGFDVDDRVEEDMSPVKQRWGILPQHASCHTAAIGGYVVEGHVPASDIRRLLREKPAIAGLVLPGMPLGSPGMEAEGVDAPPYTVLALDRQGRTTPYAEHTP